MIYRYNNKNIEGKIITIRYIKKTSGKYQHKYNLTIEVNNNNKIDTLELIKYYENNDSMLKKPGDNITINYNLLFKNYSYLYAPKSYIYHKNIINYIISSILFTTDFYNVILYHNLYKYYNFLQFSLKHFLTSFIGFLYFLIPFTFAT